MDQSSVLLDIDFGMSQLSGNKTLLVTLLEKFSEEYRSLDEELKALISNDEYDNAYALIHTLKGVTGNLGLFALHHASKPLEASLRNDRILPDDYPAFLTILNDTLIAVKNLSSAPEDVSSTAKKPAVLEQTRTDFIAALKASEFISQSTLDEWLEVLALPDSTKQGIEDAVDELDYEEAIALLEKT